MKIEVTELEGSLIQSLRDSKIQILVNNKYPVKRIYQNMNTIIIESDMRDWHTGSPSEKGWYLLYYPQSEEQPYELAQYDGEYFVAVKPFHAIVVRIDPSTVPYWRKIEFDKEN